MLGRLRRGPQDSPCPAHGQPHNLQCPPTRCQGGLPAGDTSADVGEAAEEEAGLQEDGGPALEPFNLQQEREQGRFDEGGHYVENRDEGDTGAWMAGAEGELQNSEAGMGAESTLGHAPMAAHRMPRCISGHGRLGAACRRRGGVRPQAAAPEASGCSLNPSTEAQSCMPGHTGGEEPTAWELNTTLARHVIACLDSSRALLRGLEAWPYQLGQIGMARKPKGLSSGCGSGAGWKLLKPMSILGGSPTGLGAWQIQP